MSILMIPIFSGLTVGLLHAETGENKPPFLTSAEFPSGTAVLNLQSEEKVTTAGISSATVSGFVFDADTQEPVLRARLGFYDASSGELLVENVFTGEDGSFEANLSTGVNIERTPNTASEYWLGNVYPNPVSSTDRITVQFTTPGDQVESPVIEMFDVLGRRVYPSSMLASGVYFYRLRFSRGNLTSTRSFVLTRSGALSINLQQKLEEPADTYKPMPGIQSAGDEGIRIVVYKKAYQGFEMVRTSVTLNESIRIDLDPAELPTAAFATGDILEAGRPVTFDASESTGPDGQKLTYAWDFGDGRRGGQEKIARIYPDGGTFLVTLTTATAEGATSITSQEITISPAEVSGRNVKFLGSVRDKDGAPIQNAELSVRGSEGTWLTDSRGIVELNQVPADAGVTLQVRRDGYAVQRIPFDLSGEVMDAYYFETVMLQRHESVTLHDIEFGAAAAGASGASVVLPPEALVDADGNIVTGDVQMAITPVDISNPEARNGFPGNFEGIAPDGTEELIVSYGAAEYVFEQNGQPLQLAPGMTAIIEIPVFAGRHLDGTEIREDDEIPMWSLHPETGKWIEEGMGVIVASETSPTGFVQRGEVGHFSWWNCDIAPNTPRARTKCHLGDSPEARRICQVLAQGRNRPLDAPILPGSIQSAGCDLDIADRPFGVPRNTIVGEDGSDLVIPPDYPLLFRAIAEGGALHGEVEVCLPEGATEDVTIELFPILIPEAIPINIGDTRSGRLEFGRGERYKFIAGEGDYIRIEARPEYLSSVNGLVALLNEAEETLGSAGFGPGLGTIFFRVEAAGEYLIDLRIADFADMGYYVVSLDELESANTAIAYGQTVSGFIFPESVDRYTFSGSQNDNIWIRATTQLSYNLQGKITLTNTEGETLTQQGFSMQTGEIFYQLEKSGEYSILVEGNTSVSSGGYRLDLVNISGQGGPIEYGSTVAGMLGQGTPIEYTFEGREGEWFWSEFRRAGNSGSALYSLLSPTGSGLESDPLAIFSYITQKLPVDGIYTLRVSTNSTEPFLFSLRADTIPTGRPPLNYEQWESEMTKNGVPVLYRFPGTAGQHVRVELEPDPALNHRDLNFRFLSVLPGGVSAFREVGANDVALKSLIFTEDGDGEVVVGPWRGHTFVTNEGLFRLRILEEIIPPPGGLKVDYGEEIISTLRPEQLHEWIFEGTEGDPVRLHVEKMRGGPRMGTMSGVLHLPSGVTEAIPDISASSTFGFTGVLFNPLPESGTYRLVLSEADWSFYSGERYQPYNILLNRITSPPVGLLNSGVNTRRTLNEPYEIQRHCIGSNLNPDESTTVTVSAGTAGGASSDGWWVVKMFDPEHQLIGSGNFRTLGTNRFNVTFDVEITQPGPHFFYVGRQTSVTERLGGYFIEVNYDEELFDASVCNAFE